MNEQTYVVVLVTEGQVILCKTAEDVQRVLGDWYGTTIPDWDREKGGDITITYVGDRQVLIRHLDLPR